MRFHEALDWELKGRFSDFNWLGLLGFFVFPFLAGRKLDGVAGIEPANGGIKIHCLTTWLHPNEIKDSERSKIGAQQSEIKKKSINLGGRGLLAIALWTSLLFQRLQIPLFRSYLWFLG